MYLEDLSPGFRFETEARTMTEDAILAFAAEWDPQPFHLDHEAARTGPFGGLTASGFHTLLTSFLQSVESGIWRDASLGSPGIEELRWLVPMRPGDRLTTVGEVVSVTPSRSRQDRGRALIAYTTTNGEGVAVMTWRAVHILRRRPDTERAGAVPD